MWFDDRPPRPPPIRARVRGWRQHPKIGTALVLVAPAGEWSKLRSGGPTTEIAINGVRASVRAVHQECPAPDEFVRALGSVVYVASEDLRSVRLTLPEGGEIVARIRGPLAGHDPSVGTVEVVLDWSEARLHDGVARTVGVEYLGGRSTARIQLGERAGQVLVMADPSLLLGEVEIVNASRAWRAAEGVEHVAG